MLRHIALAAFAFQAVGALAGRAVGYAVLVAVANLSAWQWMFANRGITRAAGNDRAFLYNRERELAAGSWRVGPSDRRNLQAVGENATVPAEYCLSPSASAESHAADSFMALFHPRNIRAPILASVPWSLQDLST